MWCHFAHWCEGNQLIFLHQSIHLVLSSLLKRLFLSILLSEHSWWKIKCLQMQCLFFDFQVYRINSHFSWLFPSSFNYYSSVGIFFVVIWEFLCMQIIHFDYFDQIPPLPFSFNSSPIFATFSHYNFLCSFILKPLNPHSATCMCIGIRA